MLAYLFIAALTFTTGECPEQCPNRCPNQCPNQCPSISVEDGQYIVLQYNTTTGTNLENEFVDLKREKSGTSRCFEELLVRRNGLLTRHDSRCSFNPDDLKSGVVTANITSATTSDSGLYEIYIPNLNKCQQFTVTVAPEKFNKDDPDNSSLQNQTDTTPGGGDERNIPAIVGSCVAIGICIIGILLFIYRKKIMNWLRPKQQQENGGGVL